MKTITIKFNDWYCNKKCSLFLPDGQVQELNFCHWQTMTVKSLKYENGRPVRHRYCIKQFGGEEK